MLLVIDVGNTNVSFGIFDGPDLAHHLRCESARARTADEYAVLVHEMMRLRGVDPGRIRGRSAPAWSPPSPTRWCR
jgi:type III pantothenate kinase